MMGYKDKIAIDSLRVFVKSYGTMGDEAQAVALHEIPEGHNICYLLRLGTLKRILEMLSRLEDLEK